MVVVASRATAHTTITCSTTNHSISSGLMNTVTTTITVNLPPLEVRLEAPGEWVSGGQQTTFRCRVVGASPEPQVQWWLAGRQLAATTPLTTVAGNVSVSTVKLTPEPGDHGAPLVCKAFSPNLPGTVLHDQLTLAVHFVPVATISISGGGGGEAGVREGGSVTFTCHLKANPKVYNVTWFHNGRPLRRAEWGTQATYTTLRLHNVTADMRGLYTCLGSNQEGDGQSNALNLNVEFAPVCQEDQRQEYVAPRGGSVIIACTVVAYPASVTFSWAIKRTPESQPVRLHSVGRKEGLTGHYTLTRVEEESVEVWCWAQNTVGAQTAPCKFTVYTQAHDILAHNYLTQGCRICNITVANHEKRRHGVCEEAHARFCLQSGATAALLAAEARSSGDPTLGIDVGSAKINFDDDDDGEGSTMCRGPPTLSLSGELSLLGARLKQESSRGGSEESSSSSTSRSSSSSTSRSSSSSRGTQQKKEGGGGAVHTLGQSEDNYVQLESLAVADMLSWTRSMTLSTRSAMALTPVTLSSSVPPSPALTRPHNLPTTAPAPPLTPSPSSNSVGGLQSGQEFALVVQVSNEEGVSPPVVLSAFTLKDNAQTVIGMPTGNGVLPISGGGGAGGVDGVSPGGGMGGPGGGVGVGSIDAEEDEGPGGNTRLLELVPPMVIVLMASLTTILVMALLVILLLKKRGRMRRLEQEMDQVKLSKEMVPVHSRGEDSPSSRDTPGSSRKVVEMEEASGGGTGGGGGAISGIRLGRGMVGGGHLVGVGGVVGIGGVVGARSSVDNGSFSSCNGDLMTTTSRDFLLGPRSKPGDMLETFRGGSTTLPILGIQHLADDTGRHVVLEGLRPLGTSLSSSCSSFRSGVPIGGVTNMGSMGGATNKGVMGEVTNMGVMGGASGMLGASGLVSTPSTSSSHLLQVSLLPETVEKDRGPTPSPREYEGVSVL
ncbi:uncharacterized protein [Procambarus clarkii]|uniref:uncharacterized protein n=1 Tax=Procambarus clarkii TaxID=6728 RepID=UPI0037437935